MKAMLLRLAAGIRFDRLRNLGLAAGLGWGFSLVISSLSFAQSGDYPTRVISLVAPSTPGSAPDVLSRLVANELSKRLGQQVVVLNRAGAGGNLGTVSVTQAAPDGYTILLGSIANTLNPHIMKAVGYRIEDLAPISSVAAAPDILVVHPSVNAKTVQELVTLLKNKPGTPAGHAGIGTTPHLSLEVFRRAAGVEVTMVPFKGGGQAQQGILAAEVPFMFSTSVGVLPLVRNGQLRALGVSSSKRMSAAPEIPTVAESGFPDFDVVAWFGLFAPAETPKAIIDRLSDETRAALSSPELRKQFQNVGAEPLGSTPADFTRYVADEYERWGKLTKEAGITIDKQ